MSSRDPDGPVYRGNVSVEEAAAMLEDMGEDGEEETAVEPANEETAPTNREQARRAAAAAGEAARREAQAATERGRQDARRAASELRRRARRFARRAGGSINFDEFVDRRKKSRNKQVAERAEQAATMAPPTEHTLDILGTGTMPAEMARASTHMGAADLERPADGADPAPGLDPGVGGVDPTVDAGLMASGREPHGDPDWHDNPEHLDTPAEVREDLMDDGLDPMDTETEQEALFGHALVHGYANDPDMGGRTPAQLEAEHDMVVDAMDDFGFDHDSPLDFHEFDGLVEEDL